MNKYFWRVVKDNRFLGYVVAMSQWDAEKKAVEFYGKNIWVERFCTFPVKITNHQSIII
jgi:hypothetical protein